MAIDSPARIAVIGAGPIGLEAALYARFLGYEVEIFERARLCERLREWSHVPGLVPFSAIRSSLALAALAAHDRDWRPPPEDALLGRAELLNHYYAPLAATDLLDGCLRERCEVTHIGREGSLKYDLPGDDRRADSDFRLLVRHTGERQEEKIAIADAVLDCSGVGRDHNWLGRGGIPAPGEQAAGGRIDYDLPDILGRDREKYAHVHTLLIGAGHSAATCALALAELAHEAPYTQVTWITRDESPPRDAAPISQTPHDPFSSRDRLAVEANRLAAGHAGDRVVHFPGVTVERIDPHPDGLTVHLSGKRGGEFEFARILACVGHRPRAIHSELQVAEHHATQEAVPPVPEAGPRNFEPDYYILGSKSFGRRPGFEMGVGLDQIRRTFAIIGDRADLNLYDSIRSLPS